MAGKIRPWSDAELSLLQEHAALTLFELTKLLPARSAPSIRRKRLELGFKKGSAEGLAMVGERARARAAFTRALTPRAAITLRRFSWDTEA
jgi:hypothetical protein